MGFPWQNAADEFVLRHNPPQSPFILQQTGGVGLKGQHILFPMGQRSEVQCAVATCSLAVTVDRVVLFSSCMPHEEECVAFDGSSFLCRLFPLLSALLLQSWSFVGVPDFLGGGVHLKQTI